MNSAGKTISTPSENNNGKPTTYKDGEKSHKRETTLDKQMAKLVPNDVRKAMAKLSFEEKQSIWTFSNLLISTSCCLTDASRLKTNASQKHKISLKLLNFKS